MLFGAAGGGRSRGSLPPLQHGECSATAANATRAVSSASKRTRRGCVFVAVAVAHRDGVVRGDERAGAVQVCVSGACDGGRGGATGGPRAGAGGVGGAVRAHGEASHGAAESVLRGQAQPPRRAGGGPAARRQPPVPGDGTPGILRRR